MSEKQKVPSLLEIMNDVLSTVRDYYDSEYVYYIERDEDEILTIYEWCAEFIPWQRDRIKMMDPEQWPKWLKQELLNTTEESYSVHRQLEDGVTAVLAAVKVHRGGCELSLLHAVIPYVTQVIISQKMQKQQEYLCYHDSLTGLMNRNSFVVYLSEAEERELQSLGALSVDINGLKNFNKEFGREYGDEVVSRVGEVLEEYFRPGSVYRLTGDEYLAVAEDISYENDFSAKYLDNNAVSGITFTRTISDRIESMITSMNIVTYVLVVSAGLLAFIVLYNLNNINISERQRELATLKVLGFYDGEISMYVFRENIMLTVLGTIFGIFFGIWLHRFVILTAELDIMMFGRQIYTKSYIYSILLTIGFSIIVNIVMHWKMKKIDMIESLKSVE